MLYQASGSLALVEDVLHLIGHLALLSLATAVTWSLAQAASTGKR